MLLLLVGCADSKKIPEKVRFAQKFRSHENPS